MSKNLVGDIFDSHCILVSVRLCTGCVSYVLCCTRGVCTLQVWQRTYKHRPVQDAVQRSLVGEGDNDGSKRETGRLVLSTGPQQGRGRRRLRRLHAGHWMSPGGTQTAQGLLRHGDQQTPVIMAAVLKLKLKLKLKSRPLTLRAVTMRGPWRLVVVDQWTDTFRPSTDGL